MEVKIGKEILKELKGTHLNSFEPVELKRTQRNSSELIWTYRTQKNSREIIWTYRTQGNSSELGVGRAQARPGSARLVTKEGSCSSLARLEAGSRNFGSKWLGSKMARRILARSSARLEGSELESSTSPGRAKLDQAWSSFIKLETSLNEA